MSAQHSGISDEPLKFSSNNAGVDKLLSKDNLPAMEPTDKNDPTLTHFHSFFYDTFTWKYPRSTGLLFAGSLALLLLGHYVDILRYAFKGAYITFAITAVFEYLGRPTTGTGFMTQVRPQRYYKIPRENLEMFFAEVHEFLNFIVLEFQRILYVERLSHTIAAFIISFITHYLIKYLPIWGLLLLGERSGCPVYS